MNGNALPTLIFDKKTRDNEDYRKTVLDAFEYIGLNQIRFNINEYDDFYKMCDGTLSSKELKLIAPQYEVLGDLLTQAELPSSVTHWDIIGGVINTLVGKLIQMRDKFHATDTGEIAQSEFLEKKTNDLRDSLQKIIENRVKMAYIKNGINPSDGSRITDEKQKQEFLNSLEQIKRSVVSEAQEKVSKNAEFKTAGVKWAEAVIKEDEELLDFDKQHKDLFSEYLKTGSCAKITKIIYDSYKSFVWDSRTLFHSKDIGKQYLNDFSYAGRVHVQTPMQVIEEYGEYIDFKTQKKLIEGDDIWKGAYEYRNSKGSSYRDAFKSNFNKVVTENYPGETNALYYRKIEQMSGVPMGEQLFFNDEGNVSRKRTWIPTTNTSNPHVWFAKYLETRFPIDSNICQVTEVYFRAMEAIGYLTYEDSEGNMNYGEIVTEDILGDFLKENKIKNIRNLGFREMIDNFEPNTIVWQLRPVVGWGVKIVPSNLLDPIYLGVKPMDNQIVGINQMDVKLPVTGLVGKSIAKIMSPWQSLYNYAWNSVRGLMEKELGMFFVLGVGNIPSEYNEAGDTGEALMTLRNMAKSTGLMPIATNYDGLTPEGSFNQMSVHNISHSQEIQTKMSIAEKAKMNMYLSIGLQPNEGLSPTSGVTAEGIKQSQEMMQTQLESIYDDFNDFLKIDYNQHLSIAQYVRTNNLDNRIFFANDDLSINFLQLSDKNLSLRKLGIIVTDDSRRRRELESIRQVLLTRNTMDIDTQGLISLVTKNSWRELMSIAVEERLYRQQKSELEHQRRMEEIQMQSSSMDALSDKEWKRKEYSSELDRKLKIELETIKATGRASDSSGTSIDDYEQINKARQMALNETELSKKIDVQIKDLDIKIGELEERKRKSLSDEDLKKKQLELKEKEIEAKKYIAEVNKN